MSIGFLGTSKIGLYSSWPVNLHSAGVSLVAHSEFEIMSSYTCYFLLI